MTSIVSHDNFAVVGVAEIAPGCCGWSAVVVLPSGSRITTGLLRDTTTGAAALVGLGEVLRLLPESGAVQVVLPEAGDVPLASVMTCASALQARPGSTVRLPDDSTLGEGALRLIHTARELAEAEALRLVKAA